MGTSPDAGNLPGVVQPVLPGQLSSGAGSKDQDVLSKHKDGQQKTLTRRQSVKVYLDFSSRAGIASTLVYMAFAALLAISTYSLTNLANKEVYLGKSTYDFEKFKWSVPFAPLVEGNVKVSDANIADDKLVNHGTQSLSDLQYDKCPPDENSDCIAKVMPNIRKVLYWLNTAFADIPNDIMFNKLGKSPDTQVQYAIGLSGFNYLSLQYFVEGESSAITCTVRRANHRVSSETQGEIDSLAFCSARLYDPEWVCETEVPMDATTHVIKIQRKRVTYLGQTRRREVFMNPGNEASLTGSSLGTQILSAVTAVSEYNEGTVSSFAPWDIVPAYSCKGTIDRKAIKGWYFKGQGANNMIWKSDSLMLTNAIVLCAVVIFLFVMQMMYLSQSSVCVIPVYMAKTAVGYVVLFFACYGNYNVQVLTTFLGTTNVTEINGEWYRYCGALMMASVVGVMSGTTIQMIFNPSLATPSYILTVISIVNFAIVFILEAEVFPKQNDLSPQGFCSFSNSVVCSQFSAVNKNYFLSAIIASSTIIIGSAAIFWHKRLSRTKVPSNHSVLQLFGVDSVERLATSTWGGCVQVGPNGSVKLDMGLLLNKNLIRVSNRAVVRVCIVKYVMLYRLLPFKILRHILSEAVGLILVFEAENDHVKPQYRYILLEEMELEKNTHVESYCK